MRSESKSGWLPMCHYKKCHVVDLMQDAYRPWLFVFYMLKSDILSSNGVGKHILEDGEMLDLASLSLFAEMDAAYNQAMQDNKEKS